MKKAFSILYDIFHLPSTLLYIVHIIFWLLYNWMIGTFNQQMDLQETINIHCKEANKFFDIRDYIDYPIWLSMALFFYLK